jgi:hypothetical protein
MLPSSPAAAKQIGARRYFTGMPCKRGHVAERSAANAQCVLCSRELSYQRSKLPHVKKMNALNKKKQSARLQQKEYAARNRTYIANQQTFVIPQCMPKEERARAYARAYYHANKQKMKKPDPIKRRQYINIWSKQFRKKPCGAATYFMRKSLQRCLFNKKDRTEIILGYTKHDLIKNIEFQFLIGMNWENYGEWHIDHIVPISYFFSVGVDDPKKINALSNLRPLWAKENLSKGKKHVAAS